jgi:superfamily II DNA/RNA helicase
LRLISLNGSTKGLDISNVHRVIEFMVPSSLSILTQHFGRGGRSGEPTIAILLVEKSVYQRQSGRPSQSKEGPGESSHDRNTEEYVENNEDEDEEDDENNLNDNEKVDIGPSYRKKIDEHLRAYICASDCRRTVSNDYFQNPSRTSRKFILLAIYTAGG